MRLVDLFFCLQIRLTIFSLSEVVQKNEFSTGAPRKFNRDIFESGILRSRLEATFEKQLLNTSAMADQSLTVESFWFRITSLLLFLYRIKLFKVFQVSLELFEHSEFSLEIIISNMTQSSCEIVFKRIIMIKGNNAILLYCRNSLYLRFSETTIASEIHGLRNLVKYISFSLIGQHWLQITNRLLQKLFVSALTS